MREARYVDDGITNSTLTSDFLSFFSPTFPFELIGVYSEHTHTRVLPPQRCIVDLFLLLALVDLLAQVYDFNQLAASTVRACACARTDVRSEESIFSLQNLLWTSHTSPRFPQNVRSLCEMCTFSSRASLLRRISLGPAPLFLFFVDHVYIETKGSPPPQKKKRYPTHFSIVPVEKRERQGKKK